MRLIGDGARGCLVVRVWRTRGLGALGIGMGTVMWSVAPLPGLLLYLMQTLCRCPCRRKLSLHAGKARLPIGQSLQGASVGIWIGGVCVSAAIRLANVREFRMARCTNPGVWTDCGRDGCWSVFLGARFYFLLINNVYRHRAKPKSKDC
jgi:hypothetical protein